MVKKTRKIKKLRQKGGAIHKLPADVAPTTGAPKTNLINNFFTKNKLYYIDTHGAMLDSTYIVPEKTYILHAGISGKSIHTQYCSGEGKFVGENDMMDLVQKENKADLWKLLTGESGASSISMFSPKKFEPEGVSLAIYEPGDEVHDMIFKFSNEGHTSELAIRLAGIYEIPVRDNLFKIIEEAEMEKARKLKEYSDSNAGKKASIADKKKREIEISNAFAKEKDIKFRNDKDNILQEFFKRQLNKSREESRYTMKESNIVYDEALFPPPADGVRIFIVWACRSAYTASSEEERVAKGKTMRRKSLSLRKYNEGVREAYEKAEEQRKERLRIEAAKERLRQKIEELKKKHEEEMEKKLTKQHPLAKKFTNNLKSGKKINWAHFNAMKTKVLQAAKEENERLNKILNEALEELEAGEALEEVH